MNSCLYPENEDVFLTGATDKPFLLKHITMRCITSISSLSDFYEVHDSRLYLTPSYHLCLLPTCPANRHRHTVNRASQTCTKHFSVRFIHSRPSPDQVSMKLQKEVFPPFSVTDLRGLGVHCAEDQAQVRRSRSC